jgi:sucrose-6-phosphate hydrolase SacC (GH32 family)
MTFPTELQLKKSFDGYRLCPKPIREIKTLVNKTIIKENLVLNKENRSFVAPVKGDVLHITAEFEQGGASEFGLNVNGYELNYNQFYADFNKINYPVSADSFFKIEVIVDKKIAEVFVNDGELYFVKSLPFENRTSEIKAFVGGVDNGRHVVLKRLEIRELKSVWTENQQSQTASESE